MSIRRFLAVTGTTGAMVLAAAGCNSAVKGWASPDVNVGSNSGSSSSQSASAKPSGGSNSNSNKGGSAASSKSGGSAAASSTNSGGGAAASTADTGSSGASIPANFPMPPGADVNKYGGTALIQVTDPQAAYAFWPQRVAKSGLHHHQEEHVRQRREPYCIDRIQRQWHQRHGGLARHPRNTRARLSNSQVNCDDSTEDRSEGAADDAHRNRDDADANCNRNHAAIAASPRRLASDSTDDSRIEPARVHSEREPGRVAD